MPILELFDQLRLLIANTVRESLPEPQASLLLGIILGIKSGFPASFYEAMRMTGTLHVVVVSGYNIMVIINTLERLLIFLPLKVRLATVFIFVLFFMLLVGFEPPVVRAVVMGSLGLLAIALGRQTAALRALIFAGLVMVLINPEWITDLSFQLSFLATLGLILIFPLLHRLFPDRGGVLRESFLLTLAAQMAVWPLIAYSFGQFSVVSLLVNTLVLWTIPLITYLGLATTILAMLISNIKELIMIPTGFFLSYFIWIVTGAASLKVGVFEVGPFSWGVLVFYYLILSVGIWLLYLTFRKR